MSRWINIDDLPNDRVEWDDIFDAPSINIVFCKECKWYKQSEAFCENGNGLWQAGDDCFCSYGERKESE